MNQTLFSRTFIKSKSFQDKTNLRKKAALALQKINEEKEELYGIEKNKENEVNQLNESVQINAENRINTNFALRKKAIKNRFLLKENYTFKFFTDKLYSIYMEALVLDDYIKNNYASNFKKLVKDTVENLFTEGILTKNIIVNECSDFVKNLYLYCEKVADKVALKEANPGDRLGKYGDDITGEVIEEKKKKSENADASHEEFEDDISEDYDTDDFQDLNHHEEEIGQLVQTKVVHVVASEQEQAKREQEIQGDINQEIDDMNTDPDELDNETDDDMDDEPVNEEKEEPKEKNKDEITESKRLVKIINKKGKLNEFSLFKSMQINIANNYMKKLNETASATGKNIPLNMDKILAETIVYYTLLEMMHTIKLVKFNAKDAKNYAKSLIFETMFPKK